MKVHRSSFGVATYIQNFRPLVLFISKRETELGAKFAKVS